MTIGLQPSVWLEFRLEEYPSGTVTTYKWSTRPLADSGSWKEGRIAEWGEIDRALSSLDGEPTLGTMTIVLEDKDGLLRGLLSGATTQYFTSREAAVKLLSESGRAAALTPRLLRRALVSDVQPRPGRQVALALTDLVGTHFNSFDLDKLIPAAVIGEEHGAALPPESKGRVYPILAGEFNDIGVVDADGNPADKGLIPGIYVGMADVTGANKPVTHASPPVITNSGVVGTTGERRYYYAATLITPYGESSLSNIVSLNGAADRSLSNYNFIEGTFDSGDGKNRVRIWRSENATDFSVWLDEAYYTGAGTFGYPDGSAPWPNPSRNEVDREKHMTPPKTNQAISSHDHWGRFVFQLGSPKTVIAMYASDLADSVPRARMRLTANLDGVEFLTPSSGACPHPNPWIELTNPVTGETIRMGVVYLRGPRLQDHIDGVVTVAVNVCGPEDVGNGTGVFIDQAFRQLQWFLNEHVLRNAGKGYRSGNWGGLVTYANGDAQLQTSKFAAAQTQSATWIGGTGYKGAIALTEPISLREFLRRWCITFNCFIGTNHWGQVFPVLINDSASAATGRLYRDQIEVIALEDQVLDNAKVQTKVEYSFDWDPDAQAFRVNSEPIEDTTASAAHKVVRTGPLRECYFTRDRTTAVDSNARYLNLVKRAPSYATWRTDLTGLMDELGAQVRLNHYDYLVASTTTPMLVVRSRHNPNAPTTVALTGLDLGRLLSTSLPLLADEGTMAGNLGDETSESLPTTGAYELR